MSLVNSGVTGPNFISEKSLKKMIYKKRKKRSVKYIGLPEIFPSGLKKCINVD